MLAVESMSCPYDLRMRNPSANLKSPQEEKEEVIDSSPPDNQHSPQRQEHNSDQLSRDWDIPVISMSHFKEVQSNDN